jgi:CheY-like chemotaxis protein
MATDRRVLVIDDDPDIREAIRDALADEGYETIEASDGQDALNYLRGGNPAPPLILLDWNMAPMNGPKFMAEVAKDPVLSRIPVVLLTADARASETSRGMGFVDCLVKPVSLEALFAVLGRTARPEGESRGAAAGGDRDPLVVPEASRDKV